MTINASEVDITKENYSQFHYSLNREVEGVTSHSVKLKKLIDSESFNTIHTKRIFS